MNFMYFTAFLSMISVITANSWQDPLGGDEAGIMVCYSFLPHGKIHVVNFTHLGNLENTRKF